MKVVIRLDEQLVTASQRGRDNLRAFVDGGGSVYASDWAYDAIEVVLSTPAARSILRFPLPQLE